MAQKKVLLLLLLVANIQAFANCNSCKKIININNHIIKELRTNNKLIYYSTSQKIIYNDSSKTTINGEIPYISKLYSLLGMDDHDLDVQYLITFNFLTIVKDWIENNCSEKKVKKAIFISEKEFDYILDHIED